MIWLVVTTRAEEARLARKCEEALNRVFPGECVMQLRLELVSRERIGPLQSPVQTKREVLRLPHEEPDTQAKGQITVASLHATVLSDELSEKDARDLTALTGRALGLDPERGDTIEVDNTPWNEQMRGFKG